MPTENVYEQLSFAQYIEGLQNGAEQSAPTSKKSKAPVKSKKPEMPELLKNTDNSDIESLIKTLNKKGFFIETTHYSSYHRETVISAITPFNKKHLINTERLTGEDTLKDYIFLSNGSHGCGFDVPLVYFDNNGVCWATAFSFHLKGGLYNLKNTNYMDTVDTYKAPTTWKQTNKLIYDARFLQTEAELGEIVKNNFPYGYEFCVKNNCSFSAYLMAPQLEILHKAGFSFAKNFFTIPKHTIYRHSELKNSVDCFNRLCKPGKNPKEIFKTSKTVYTLLKNEWNMQKWDSFRKLDKFGRLNQDTIQQVYDMNLTSEDLKKLNEILNKTYNGRPVFTFNSLITYLNRLDMYEAIDRREAFMLLKDYLTMCNQINQEPKVDGDSLKREHDVTARTVRQHRNEIMAKEIQAGCDRLQKYNYQEGVYFIRGIRSYDDLINEATQQHNCVASYAGSIKSGHSMIYVMREVAHPDKSLVTVELAPKDKVIRQKYLAYNRPIHNRSQSEFLERWLQHVKDVDAGITPVQNINLSQTQAKPILPNQIPDMGGMVQAM